MTRLKSDNVYVVVLEKMRHGLGCAPPWSLHPPNEIVRYILSGYQPCSARKVVFVLLTQISNA